MGLETPVFGGLVIRAGAALVNLAQNPSSHCSLLPLQKAIALLHLNTTVILSRSMELAFNIRLSMRHKLSYLPFLSYHFSESLKQ